VQQQIVRTGKYRIEFIRIRASEILSGTGYSVDIDALVSPFGVVSDVGRLSSPRGLSRIHLYSGSAGARASPSNAPPSSVGGSGKSFDAPELARLIATAETAERYAKSDPVTDEADFRLATDLPGRVVDHSVFPRCSETEYSHPKCPIRPYDPTEPVRWVRGIDLTDGEPTWVPAVMACYGLKGPRPSERFSERISTGYSVHSDPAEAVVGGILEVAERDSIAVTWLQRLSLPRWEPQHSSEQLSYLTAWSEKHHLTTYLFDATTDLGIPTIYAVQASLHDDHARHTVGCASDRDLLRAAEKALRDTIMIRSAHHVDEPVPSSRDDFTSLTDGARFMGRPEATDAFGFLLNPTAPGRPPREAPLPQDPGEALGHLVEIFQRKRMAVIAVDRTTTDLAQAGLTAVSVVIPALQPMSTRPLTQFLAHPRLYDAPKNMGYAVLAERELNQWPQPFA
jgi:ribosomal protein S12 methylthiotransferase accessory factor